MAGYKSIGDDRVEVHPRESIWDTEVSVIAFFIPIDAATVLASSTSTSFGHI
ncbi:MAG: hypothetical protein ACK4QL_08985 [Pseudanabaenaceae cyanobacterium]